MIKEVSLNLLGKSVTCNVFLIELFNEVLKLDVLVLFHRLHDTRAEMRLLLDLIRPLLLLPRLLLLLILNAKNGCLLLFVSLVKQVHQFFGLVPIRAVFDEFLGLLVVSIVLVGCSLEFLLNFLGFVSLFDDLFLQELLVSLFFIHFNLHGLNCLLVHLRHVTQKERLFANLAKLLLK